MNVATAIEKIGKSAKGAWKRSTPSTPNTFALHCLVWAPRNAAEKGPQYTAGHLAGILHASTHGASIDKTIERALFFASESLLFPNSEVPADQINRLCEDLDDLFNLVEA